MNQVFGAQHVIQDYMRCCVVCLAARGYKHHDLVISMARNADNYFVHIPICEKHLSSAHVIPLAELAEPARWMSRRT